MTRIALGIGSNIDPERNIASAMSLLTEAFPGIEYSWIYKTDAREIEDQNDFLNCCAVCETDLSAEATRHILVGIEDALGKAPPFRYGPRTIDLDLLLYGNDIIDTPDLIVPHPRMHERRFVLEPLCELIDPSELHPVLKKSWESLLEDTLDQGCHLLGPEAN